mmetsp:Transcript_42105/g.97473  ORF Transcript_42105/g.97473 Transcript_42105/m.97473 type:complete len:600 (+) Transcript_42105:210-2009(+)
MYRWLNGHTGESEDVPKQFDEFQGQVYVVDLATIDGQTEEFEGRLWLDGRVREKLPIGWHMEWQPDRTKDSDNPIALMQFADEGTALLLRTHRTRNWLPTSVLKALLSETCTKVGVVGPDKQKMQSTFNLLPVCVTDLSELARRKGIEEQGLKALSEHFGMKVRKDSRIARSNWAAPELSQGQVQYAAEDAYFSFLLHDKLRNLPDFVLPDQDGYENVNQGVLQLEPGWEEQGIERRHDGLYCALCEKGPMTVPMVVARHMEGKNHRRRMENKFGLGLPGGGGDDLPDEYLLQGIVAGDGLNDVRVGEFRCMICEAGPFSTLQTVDQHLKSKKHVRNTAPPAPAPAVEERDTFQQHMWNMPDYVTLDGNTLTCNLCTSRATAVQAMRLHLSGDKHSRRCRAMKHDELIYIQQRDRLEVMSTGQAVVRSGCKPPKRNSSSKAATRAFGGGDAPLADKAPLPPGWEQHKDTASGQFYYYNTSTGVSQWHPPASLSVRVEKQDEAPPGLPPGWQVVHVKEEPGVWYYADIETQASQWEPPPAYIHEDWKREVDPKGKAFWRCTQKNMSFYESDPAWQRLVDQKGVIYWSNQERGIRFFELPP